MKTSHTYLAIAGLIVIAAGCAMRVNEQATDPRTKYVVRFNTPTLLKDKPKFITALGKASWRRGVTFTLKETGDPVPDNDNSPVTSSVTQTLIISQDSMVNPNSLHVTQRVGFNKGQEKELDALLKQVKE